MGYSTITQATMGEPTLPTLHLANLLDEKQKVGSARRVTRLARSSFLHKNTLTRPVIPAKARKSEHARELLARASKGVKG